MTHLPIGSPTEPTYGHEGCFGCGGEIDGRYGVTKVFDVAEDRYVTWHPECHLAELRQSGPSMVSGRGRA